MKTLNIRYFRLPDQNDLDEQKGSYSSRELYSMRVVTDKYGNTWDEAKDACFTSLPYICQ